MKNQEDEYIYAEATTTVTARVSTKTKANLLREAKAQGMTLSQYMGYTLEIEGENQKEVVRLQEQVAELTIQLKDKKQAFTDEAVNCNQEALLGVQDTLATMQEQLQTLCDNQPEDLQEQINDLTEENADLQKQIEQLEEEIEELRELQENKDEDEDEEDEGISPTKQGYRELLIEKHETINRLRNQNETDCTQAKKSGEEAIVKIAEGQFTKVVDMVAKDYTFGAKAIKKQMWAIFKGLPEAKNAWNKLQNPFSELPKR
jgi:chromosome segregation ATPase